MPGARLPAASSNGEAGTWVLTRGGRRGGTRGRSVSLCLFVLDIRNWSKDYSSSNRGTGIREMTTRGA